MDLRTNNSSLRGIIVIFVVLLLFSVCGTTGEEVCDSPLVSNLPASSFGSSSQLSNSHGPGFAKLNRREGAGGWSPLTSDRYQWLEVDLGGRTQISAVATQGRYGSSDWLTEYLLMFSDTGHNWRQYRQEDSVGSFPGNGNADSVVQHRFQQAVLARYLRLVPLDWNPSGRIGLRLEMYGCPYASDVVSFGGDNSSSLLYSRGTPPAGGSGGNVTPPQASTRENISLKFKTLRNSGMLLHAGGASEGTAAGLTLELDKGRLLLLATQGRALRPSDGRVLSLGSLLDDQQWHHVEVERLGAQLNVTVDKSTAQILLPEHFTHWDVTQLSVGAIHQSHASQRVSKKRWTSFHGCMENLLYNGLNLVDMARQRHHLVTVMGHVTFSCAEPVSVAVTFVGSGSFLQLPGATAGGGGAPPPPSPSVGLQFRTWNKAGLLLTFDLPLPQQGGVAWLYLSEAKLRLQIHKAGRALLELSAGSDLNDGQWHSVELTSRPGHVTITVDGATAHASPSFPVATGSDLFFGGCPGGEAGGQECRNPFNGFQGCMRLLTVGGRPVDLTMVEQRLLGNYSHLQVDMCGIIDRCSPSRCEHGGRCTQSWRTFHCNCSNSGYTGATCHRSTYEQSCDAYKHRGNASGLYHIDVDGSGELPPQLVYCNMTEEQTWTLLQHNNTELTRVPPSPHGGHSAHFDYSANEEQLAAVIDQSEHCQQELTYHCKQSRLLNTPEGSPFSWWLGGPGEGQVQTYWAGASPGSRQCACGPQGSCLDPRHYCNCDADHNQWANDSGLVTQKGDLPVRAVFLGDVQRPGSEAAYRVGPLSCHGDKNLWNAAFFDKDTSYLHFPTFHGELSADISFLFKTTASSGVFLENLGIKDFIRIELSSPTEVLFSFDVGNGPSGVRVQAAAPLNDERWHAVRAERNVKEAWLQVDRLPPATQEAPPDGHTHLTLNSQLFIGGTASRQKGFRGCVRALQLNGLTVDLEERARITPGVRPGCPGHCSSYGQLCRRPARCLERTAGFSCDCVPTAYTGAFCTTEVSASFTPSTSVSYTFKEPYEQLSSRNGSTLASSIYSDDVTLPGENVSLSFRTTTSPALLLYVSSYHREYLAVLLNKHDKLEVRYKLDSSRDAEVLRSRVRNLADGALHSLRLTRLTDHVSIQVDQNSREDFNLTSDRELNAIKSLVLGRVHEREELDPELARLASQGFSGCLSVVHFNSISPLKAALLHPGSSPVTITGTLQRSTCGSSAPANPHAAETTRHQSDQSGSVGTGQPLVNAIRKDSALIGGVIAVVIFVSVAALAIAARFLCVRKENGGEEEEEVKAVQALDDSAEVPFNAAADSAHNARPNATAASVKEYFI